MAHQAERTICREIKILQFATRASGCGRILLWDLKQVY